MSAAKLFVDYTNWHGKRAWREIEPEQGVDKIQITFDRVPVGTEGFEHTFVINVSMVDRGGARRTLRLDHIHGFKVEQP